MTRTLSPTKPKVKKNQLSFAEALQEVMTGKSITKLEWENRNIFGILKDEHLMLHKSDNRYYDWILSEGDLRGDDWVVL